MVENSDRKSVVNQTLNWADHIGTIAGPLQPNDTRESWLARAARKARISHRQCKALFYGQSKDPRHSVASKVLSAAEQARIEASRKEASQLAAIYQNAAGVLREIDQDFHSNNIDALVHAARILSTLDRT